MSEENSPSPSNSLNTPSSIEGITHAPAPATQSLSTGKNSKKKKKKNKNKVTRKSPSEALLEGVETSQSASESEYPTVAPEEYSNPAEALPEALFTLPVKPDEWFIQPATYDNEGNLLTEEIFTFLKDGTPIISMPLTEGNFAGLSHILNERFPSQDSSHEADFFHIRKPLSDSEDANPVMTLTQRDRILATTVLDQKTLKKLISALQKHVIQTSPVTAWLNRWWKKHKVWRVILCIAAAPFAALLLYTIFWGATH